MIAAISTIDLELPSSCYIEYDMEYVGHPSFSVKGKFSELLRILDGKKTASDIPHS